MNTNPSQAAQAEASGRLPAHTSRWLRAARARRGILLASSLGLLGMLTGGWSAVEAATTGDDFNDNSRNATKWGADRVVNHGVLTQRNGRLEYTSTAGLLEDDAIRPWILTRFPVTNDWQIQVDLSNLSHPAGPTQVNSMGLKLLSTRDGTNEVFAELYSSSLGAAAPRTGFLAELDAGDTRVASVDREGGVGVTNGAMRLAFDSTNRVVTVSYDLDTADGYQWVEQATFGVGGSGGVDGNSDWDLAATDQFSLYLYGYSQSQTLTSGQVFADNFVETGGVAPAGGASPDPLGNFHFAFPTNNPALVRILSVIGNYQGVSPSVPARNYNLDVAEDESGRLTALGTVDGFVDSTGSTEISESIGVIRTVQGEPAARISGTFRGTRDGLGASIRGRATLPVEWVDLGGGTNGLEGTGSYSSRIGGIPLSGRNVPLHLPAPPGAAENLKKDWGLQLEITRKRIGTKGRTVASARLLLPNGDTVAYRERTVRYSARAGYTLVFTRGTNITLNPPKLDRRSSITVKGFQLTQPNPALQEWQPTNGTVRYRFLGQDGTARLTDLLGP